MSGHPSGPPVVLVPSLGRAGSDFADLTGRLAAAGHRAIAVDPPGLVRGDWASRPAHPPLPAEPDLHDLAAAVAEVIEANGPDPAHLVGHALGNRIARCLAADHPDLVASLTLLAAGGLVEPEPGVWEALAGCFALDAPVEQRRSDVAHTFFADAAGADVWLDGWYPAVAAMQRAAVVRTDRDDWWHAVAPRVLVVQGLQDRVAVPANGRAYVDSLLADGVDARLVEVDGAGHALLPEQPEVVASALVDFLAWPAR